MVTGWHLAVSGSLRPQQIWSRNVRLLERSQTWMSTAAEGTRVRALGDHRARPRHRREHGNLRHRERRIVAATPVRRTRSARPVVAYATAETISRCDPIRALGGELSRLASAEHGVLIVGRLQILAIPTHGNRRTADAASRAHRADVFFAARDAAAHRARDRSERRRA